MHSIKSATVVSMALMLGAVIASARRFRTKRPCWIGTVSLRGPRSLARDDINAAETAAETERAQRSNAVQLNRLGDDAVTLGEGAFEEAMWRGAARDEAAAERACAKAEPVVSAGDVVV
jgi:hypothetical protein